MNGYLMFNAGNFRFARSRRGAVAAPQPVIRAKHEISGSEKCGVLEPGQRISSRR
jgi:hypothetical protein